MEANKKFVPTTVSFTAEEIASDFFSQYENEEPLVEVDDEKAMLGHLTDEVCQEYTDKYFLSDEDSDGEEERAVLVFSLLVRLGLVKDDQ